MERDLVVFSVPPLRQRYGDASRGVRGLPPDGRVASGGPNLPAAVGSGRGDATKAVLSLLNSRLYIADVQELLVDRHVQWRATLGRRACDVRAALDNERDPPGFRARRD